MQRSVILILMLLVIGLPFAFRKKQEQVSNPDAVLVIMTPHDQSIRSEFTHGFRKWYKEKTGDIVDIDWRNPGGTSEIAKFINSEYTNAFKNHWEQTLGLQWSQRIQDAFINPDIIPDNSPEDDSPEEGARRTFLGSNVGCGMDVFFGGGAYDFIIQANAGRLVPSGILKKYPERFSDKVIPAVFNGENFYDDQGRWVGNALSTFGILYNNDIISKLKDEGRITRPPMQWTDLGSHAYYASVGVTDPTKSGSTNKAFEMIVQQQIQDSIKQERIKFRSKSLSDKQKAKAIALGWERAMQLIQRISANARYFTNRSTKPVVDVAQGNCAVGMCIDFYGRSQEENISNRTGKATRVTFITPHNGTTVSTDPVGILRGAPNPTLALDFIDFATSETGQKIWDYKKGTPGGPIHFTLRRPPIRKDLYTEKHRMHMADPDANPYLDTGEFVYHPEWTGKLFSTLRFIIRASFIDVHHELRVAWHAIITAHEEKRFDDADAAMKVFSDMSAIGYSECLEKIRPALKGKKINEVRLAKELSQHFRSQYEQATAIANGLIAELN